MFEPKWFMVNNCNSSTEVFTSFVPAHWLFSGDTLRTDKVIIPRKQPAHAIFPALEELEGVCL